MKQFFLGILLTLTGALISWILAQYKMQEEVSYLEYVSINKSSLVKLEDELFNKIKFQYQEENSQNWKEIPNISVATIQFINSSKKHLEDVELLFEINSPKDNKSYLIGSAIQVPPSYDQKYITRSKLNTTDMIGLNFKAINISTESPDDYFSVSFLFAGENAPEILPKVVKKGVGIRVLDRSKESLLKTTLFITIYFGTIILFIWSAISSGKKANKRFKDEFNASLSSYFNLIKENDLPEKEDDFISKIDEIRKNSGKRDNLFKRLKLKWSKKS